VFCRVRVVVNGVGLPGFGLRCSEAAVLAVFAAILRLPRSGLASLVTL